jgi:hypothetical protein
MRKQTMTTVYPCQCPELHHLTGYAREPLEVPKDHARWLVATKAFSYDPDGLHARTETHESATWPPPDGDLTTDQDPPEGGSSDSSSPEG